MPTSARGRMEKPNQIAQYTGKMNDLCSPGRSGPHLLLMTCTAPYPKAASRHTRLQSETYLGEHSARCAVALPAGHDDKDLTRLMHISFAGDAPPPQKHRTASVTLEAFLRMARARLTNIMHILSAGDVPPPQKQNRNASVTLEACLRMMRARLKNKLPP